MLCNILILVPYKYEFSLVNVGDILPKHVTRWTRHVHSNLKHLSMQKLFLGSIQTGRANIKSTAALLYKIYNAAGPV